VVTARRVSRHDPIRAAATQSPALHVADRHDLIRVQRA